MNLPGLPGVTMVDVERLRRTMERVSIAARPIIAQIAAMEVAPEVLLHYAREVGDGPSRHRAVTHARQQLRRIRKQEAERYR